MTVRMMVVLLALVSCSCAKEGLQGPKGEKGDGANPIISNKLINSHSTDLCTELAGEVCLFNGGQLVRFFDHSVLVIGVFFFAYGPGVDTDSDSNTVSMIIPPTQSAAYVRLSPVVARGSGYRSLYLTFERSGEALRLVLDSDSDGIIEASDEVLATLSTSAW